MNTYLLHTDDGHIHTYTGVTGHEAIRSYVTHALSQHHLVQRVTSVQFVSEV